MIFPDSKRTCRTIGRADPMIAAIALQHGLAPVTAIKDLLRRVQELGNALELDNWREPRVPS